MKSFSYILPVRIDNDDRLENLRTCLAYLNKYFSDSETIVVEDDSEPKCKHLAEVFQMCYYFIHNTSHFSKSIPVNEGLRKATRENVAIWDVDCMVLPEQMERADKLLSKRKYQVILPHNSIFVNIKNDLKKNIIENQNLEIVPRFKHMYQKSSHPDVEVYPIPSGVVLINREVLLRIGGYNGTMKSYGWEDIEILKRARNLGIYYFSFAKGNIIHLNHQRGSDSQMNQHYEKNKAEFLRIKGMKKRHLVNLVNEKLSLDTAYLCDEDFVKSVEKENRKYLLFIRFIINRFINKIIIGKFK